MRNWPQGADKTFVLTFDFEMSYNGALRLAEVYTPVVVWMVVIDPRLGFGGGK